jgi:hypothetical protein
MLLLLHTARSKGTFDSFLGAEDMCAVTED